MALIFFYSIAYIFRKYYKCRAKKHLFLNNIKEVLNFLLRRENLYICAFNQLQALTGNL